MKIKLPFIFLAVAIAFSTCKKPKENFESPRALFVDYISSHTGGVISKASEIKVRFSRNVESARPGETLNESVFNISPETDGRTFWEDSRTLVFAPDKDLKSDSEYQVELQLQKILTDIPDDRKTFRFLFKTLRQDFEVSIDGLEYEDPGNLQKVMLKGRLFTADVAAESDIRKMLRVEQEGLDLTVNWTSADGNNTLAFEIEGVSRKENASKVNIQINGDPIGVSKKTEMDYEIPSLKDFKVISGRLIKGAEKYISVIFSDPLDAGQSLTGLVSLTKASALPRTVINVNELKIYPAGNLLSEVTLSIMRSVKNSAGYALGTDYVQNFILEQIKPELILPDHMNKTIMPVSTGLVMPFQAAGLNAVDMSIFRIFPDNVLQYLQVNRLGGNYEMRRVARPVIRKTIPLNTNGLIDLNSWNTFSVNIEEYIDPEPGAIYQVEIGFRKRHALYLCSNSDEDENQEATFDDWESSDENSAWDNVEDYYYYDYDWSQRDNPCSQSYYGSRRAIRKVLFSSDLGIIAKKRDGGDLSVFVSGLSSADPISGVEVGVYDFQQQLVGSGNTDAEGKAEIELKHKPYALIAKKGDDIGYLRLDDGTSLSLSSFDVAGQSIQNGLKGFIYGERGVWRPGDTIHIGFILEDKVLSLPENHPVIAELYNPKSQLVSRKVSTEAIGNMYRFDLLTDKESPTGYWKVKMKVGGAEFNKSLRIETIKPNRLKINLEFEKVVFTYSDQNAKGNLNVRWLAGGIASNLKTQYDILFRPVKTTFPKYPGVVFDDPSRDFYSEREKAFDGRLDDNGNAIINFDLSNAKNSPGALMVNFYGTVFEQGGDMSIGSKSVKYFPYKHFVGLKVPEGDKRGMLLTDKDHKVRIVTVDSEGKPVSKSNLEVSLYRLNWRWWWDQSEDNISNYLGRGYHEPMQSGIVQTKNGEGEWTLRLNSPEWGRYFVRVYDPESGHSSGQAVYLDWPGWAGKGKRGDIAGASMLDFGIEKEEYKIGEEVRISIPSTAGNRLLVSLETGSEIINSFWVETEEGQTNISFEASADMSPNVYAHITMVQPHGQVQNDLPIRLYGIQSIKVTDPNTELQPLISMPESLKPEQNFRVRISEANGRAMSYTIAVVDEGLLDISNFETPKPWDAFFGKEALGIKTWDVYDDVIGAFADYMNQLLAIGGDAEIETPEQKKTNRFKPVVKYLGPFQLKAGASSEHEIKMPQYIGSVKTMVVASTEGAYGSAEKVTPVKQPLMILATLPRVAGPQEQIRLPVNIFLEGKSGDVEVSVMSEGALSLVGESKKRVRVNSGNDEVIFFDLKAESFIGPSKVRVSARSGNLSSNYDVEMDVIPRNPHLVKIDDKVIKSGEFWATDYVPMGLKGENEGSIEISMLPPLNIEQRINFLIRYPHGCIEQTTSSVFAQLFLDELTEIDQEQKSKIQSNIHAGIQGIKEFQHGNGGFGYWPGDNYVSLWGTNYAGHFLIEARDRGYSIPENLLNNWASFQRTEANNWTNSGSREDNDLVQAYRLYTLARFGKAEMGAMNRMRSQNNLSIQAKWRLALTYAVAGYEKQAKELIAGLSDQVIPDKEYVRYTYGSNLRDKAMILETQAYLKQEERAFISLNEIAAEMGKESKWMSTQTTAYCFIGISKYLSLYPNKESTNVTVSVQGRTARLNGSTYVQLYRFIEADKQQSIRVINNGSTPVYARLTKSGIPIEGMEKPEERNIRMQIQYTDRNDNPIDISALKQGTDFIARVSIENPGLKGTYNELALTQVFPSGWEIVNTRLDDSGSVVEKAEYVDIRDDRVMHYFDLAPNRSVQFELLLQAAYQGKYYLPASEVEAMYDNDIYGHTAGKWIEVIPDK